MLGPILGTAIIMSLEHYLVNFMQGTDMVVSIVLVVMVLAAPKGLVGLFQKRQAKESLFRGNHFNPEQCQQILWRPFGCQPGESFHSKRRAPGIDRTQRGRKTTLLNLITGIYSASRGEILFKNEAITRLRPDQISHRGISRTLQITSLFVGLTVYENIGRAVQSRKRFFNPFIRAFKWQDVREKTDQMLELTRLQARPN